MIRRTSFLFLLGFIVLLSPAAKAQKLIAPNEHFTKLPSGLEIFLEHDPQNNQSHLEWVIRHVSFPDNDTVVAMHYMMMQIYQQRAESLKSKGLIRTYQFIPSREFSRWQFSTDLPHTRWASMLLEFITLPPDSNLDLIELYGRAKTSFDKPSTSDEDTIRRRLWSNYLPTQYFFPTMDSILWPIEKFVTFHKQFADSRASLILIRSKIPQRYLFPYLSNEWSLWKPVFSVMRDKNQLLRLSLPYISTQWLNSKPSQAPFPKLQLHLTGPDFYGDKGPSFVGWLASGKGWHRSSLNLLKQPIPGICQIRLDYFPGRLGSPMTLHFDLDNDLRMDHLYELYQRITQDIGSLLTLSYHDIQSRQEEMHVYFKNAMTMPESRRFWQIHFWHWHQMDVFYAIAQKNPSAFPELNPELFFKKYFEGRTFIAEFFPVSSDSANKLPFLSTPEEIFSFRIPFARNQYELNDSASLEILKIVAQYLKVNPMVKVKVNGTLHEAEIAYFADSSLVQFRMAHPEFILHPPDVIRLNKSRLDILRSAAVVQQLLAYDVEIQQLTGTGQIIKSENMTDADRVVYFSESDTRRMVGSGSK